MPKLNPLSEIDAIFASKAKSSVAPPSQASSSSTLLSKEKKKIKDKSAKRKREGDGDGPSSKHPKRQVPETVFDPSLAPPSVKKSRSFKAEKAPVAVTNAKKPKKNQEEEERFKDSRGTGPRRKTEEGFPVYKEDELGISGQGGDTPLCPFDCQCCF